MRTYRPDPRSPFAGELRAAVADGYKRLLAPALEREVRAELTRQAEEHAIDVFATNLRNLLLQPPLRGERMLALDPGYRTGCKVAMVDETWQAHRLRHDLSPCAAGTLERGEGDAQGADRHAQLGR